MHSRKEYERFASAAIALPLYANTWWLDAVCNNDWDAFVSNDPGGEVLIPFYKTSIRRMKAVINPPMTQYLPIIRAIANTRFEIDHFIKTLPAWSILDIAFPSDAITLDKIHSTTARVKYSYVVGAKQTYEQAKSKYNEGLRRNLKEATRLYAVQESRDVDLLIRLSRESYSQRKMQPPSWINEITAAVVNALHVHQQGKIIVALLDQKPVAAILIGWDTTTHYYLLGGKINGEGAASAHALLLDHAIKESIDAGHQFDFEGSMHAGIANFFQSFGAQPVPYYHIRKYKGMGKLWSLFKHLN